MTTTTPVRHSPHRRSADPRRTPLWWNVVAGIAVVVLLAFSVLLLVADDTDEPDVVRPPVPSAAPSDQVDRSTAIWPWTGAAGYVEPVGAARAFAADFLGFAEPVVGAFQQGDSRSGEVEVRPTPDGPVTTVLLRQLSGEEDWSVLGAVTSTIEVTGPEAMALVTSPVAVVGSALAFEGHVAVQVRQDGAAAPLGEGYVVGGGDQMRAFTGSVEFTSPTETYGALVLLTRSAKDGSVWQAAALRIRLR